MQRRRQRGIRGPGTTRKIGFLGGVVARTLAPVLILCLTTNRKSLVCFPLVLRVYRGGGRIKFNLPFLIANAYSLKPNCPYSINCSNCHYCDVYTHLHFKHFKQYTPGWYQSMKSTFWLLPIFHAQHSELRSVLHSSGNPLHSLEACFLSSTWLDDLG